MRAGLLSRNYITILRFDETKTASGQLKKEKVEIATLRCNILKQKGYEKEEAKEIFQTATKIFHIRHYHDLLDTDLIQFDNQEYKIVLIDRNVWDRSIKITVQKIND